MKKQRFNRLKADFQVQEDIILRDFLAIERTTLANERTLFSYIRTGLYLIVAAIAILKLENLEEISWLGYALIAISCVLIVFGLIRYRVLQRKLHRFYDSVQLPEAPQKG